MPRISSDNQVTIPAEMLQQAQLHAGEEVVIDVISIGELRLRATTANAEPAVESLTGEYPLRYVQQPVSDDDWW